ncbi:hypothetical protein AWM68_15225 [Fictibacillus phosphorivorans]|uniref:DUF4181 domain-containing protein n=1 Tax=Fictibacillus phosphorivorans TaxID=1221500 RepID=A0A163PDG3_9BACL|nr:hypothetical protein [Fictibacillus phosphorivorans]KZE63366.1 hypothetical protein AWM68_15225 [Fictibacillus phosphorivorans]
MNVFFSILIQIVMWCGYSIVLFLSHHDHSFYETILLLMFGYFNFLVAYRFIQNRSVALHVTLSLTVVYVTGKLLFI